MMMMSSWEDYVQKRIHTLVKTKRNQLLFHCLAWVQLGFFFCHPMDGVVGYQQVFWVIYQLFSQAVQYKEGEG